MEPRRARGLFDISFGEAKGCTLIAHQWGNREWSRTEGSEIASYGIYGIDTAEALYLEDCKEIPSPARNHDDKSTSDNYHATGGLPLPEPVLPRYEALKIYAMAHGIGEPESPAKEQKSRVTAVQSKVVVELLASHGFTDTDFQGPIEALQQKVARKRLSPTLSSVTEKPVAEWLKKGGVR
ncbi:Uncharacterised protein [Serratia liquefaciens]|nr:Uncharacterised protein [Serratia liquefaciens]